MYYRLPAIILVLTMTVSSCNNNQPTTMNADTPKTDVASTATSEPTTKPQGTFGYDQEFLQRHDSIILLQEGETRVIVSAKYQGKVFTSTTSGENGPSFGWIHYKAFDGPVDPHMNAYGGENRLWLGPEGGKFSLFFAPGTKMEFANWKTPAAFDTEPWQIEKQSATSVSLKKDMELTSYAGTKLKVAISRIITILDRDSILEFFQIHEDKDLQVVGYRTLNDMTNEGDASWTKEIGMPCMWVLDMFKPSAGTTIVIPFNPPDTGKPATTDYFGEIPEDRLKIEKNVLFFKADGKQRGKLGIHPKWSRPFAGSYDSINHVLTVVEFDVSPKAPYLNQEWNTTKPPFSGDAVNAYNDGPLADGSQMGPFYEIESVAPSLTLQRGATQSHKHSVYHFTGTEAALEKACQQVFGFPLSKIKTSLQ